MGTLAFTGVQPKTTSRWKLKKVNWRIDENSKVVSVACKAHKSRIPGNNANTEKQGIEYVDTRIIGAGDIKSGWKADWTAHEGGRIEMEVEFSTHISAKPCCDVDDTGEFGSGIAVSHVMVVEAVVFEVVLSGTAGNWVESLPSGSARVLRMQFPVCVTERSGLGISWDNETPPLYDDVPQGLHLPTYDQSKSGSTDDLSKLPVHIGRGDTPGPASSRSSLSLPPSARVHDPAPGSSTQHRDYARLHAIGASHLHQVNRPLR